MQYVTWNNYSIISIRRAERRKLELEAAGYVLVHQTQGCLTYAKNTAQSN